MHQNNKYVTIALIGVKGTLDTLSPYIHHSSISQLAKSVKVLVHRGVPTAHNKTGVFLMELRRSLRHAKVRGCVDKSDENFLLSTNHINNTLANRNDKSKSKSKQKPKRAVSSRRNLRSRAPLARLDRNLVRTHNESATRSSSEEVAIVTNESFNTLEPTTSDQIANPKRPKIRMSVRAPVGSSKPSTNDPKPSVAPAEKRTVHRPVSVHPDHSSKINPKPTTQTRHPTTVIDVESPTPNINRDLGPIFDVLPGHDNSTAGPRHDLVAETTSNRKGAITPIPSIDLTSSSEKATGSSRNLKTVASNTPLMSSERMHASQIVRAPVPLWRPTNMATEEEDEITPVQNVVRRPREQVVSHMPKKSQFPATSAPPAALWRPTTMATEDEDEILPVVTSVSGRSAATPRQVTRLRQTDALTDILIDSNSTKPHPKQLPSPTSQHRIPKPSAQVVLTPSKEPESRSRLGQSIRKPLATSDDKKTNYSSSDVLKLSIDSNSGSELDHAVPEVRSERLRSGTRKRARDVHDNDLDGNDKKPSGKVYTMRARRGVPKPTLATPSQVSLSSESDGEQNSGMHNEFMEIDSEPQRSVNQPEHNSVMSPVLESSNRKRGTVQTYSKRQRTRRTDKENGEILLPSRRALGVRSASPSSEEKSMLDGNDDDSNESIERKGKEGSGHIEADSSDEKEEEPVMDDMLKVFYMAQRQLWKEVDEISLEEEFD